MLNLNEFQILLNYAKNNIAYEDFVSACKSKSNPVLNEYISGRISAAEILLSLRDADFINFIGNSGYSKKDIDFIFKTLRDPNSSDFPRIGGLKRFQRYSEKMGLQIIDPIKRVEKIKKLNMDDFLRILSNSNTMLRGNSGFLKVFRLFRGQVGGVAGNVDIIPPKNQLQHFEQHFNQMKKNLTVENLPYYAYMTFIVMIYLHMFKDGNGRTSRIAYYLIRDGTFNENENNSRNSDIDRLHIAINEYSVMKLFRLYGIKKPQDFTITYAYVSKGSEVALSDIKNSIQFLAARKTLLSKGLILDDIETINRNDFIDSDFEGFEENYEMLNDEFYGVILDIASKIYTGKPELVKNAFP